jgi:uncharacterized membrane protein YGL010W
MLMYSIYQFHDSNNSNIPQHIYSCPVITVHISDSTLMEVRCTDAVNVTGLAIL